MPWFRKTSGQEVEPIEEVPINEWTSKQLVRFLQDNKKKLELDKKDINKLKEEKWNGLSLMEFKPDELEKLGIKTGTSKALYNFFQQLTETQIQKGILKKFRRPLSVTNTNSSDISTDSGYASSSTSNSNTASGTANLTASSSTTPRLEYGIDTTMKEHQLHYIQAIIQQQQGKLLIPNLKEEGLDDDNMTTSTTMTKHNANLLNIPAEDDIRLVHDLHSPGDLSPPLIEGSSGRKSAGGGLQILTTTSNSTSNSTGDNLQVKDCPAWNPSQLTVQQRQAFENAVEKVQSLKYAIKPELVDVLSQDLIIPERFKYKFLNPDRLKQRGEGGRRGVFLKVKLVITEMDQAVFHRICRRFANTFSSTVKNSKWGMFHTALIVGPWYLEWNDSSLSTVRKKSSSKAVFTVDIAKIEGQKEVNEVIDSIAQLCTVWNGYKIYENDTCNCQHFVIDLLEYLGLGSNFEELLQRYTPLREYMTKLKQKGVCDMLYYVDDKLAKMIKDSTNASHALKELVKHKKVKFTTHKILDEFVIFIEQYLPLYMQQHPQEYELLKSFDRAFWLRSQSSQTDNTDAVEPLVDFASQQCLCPFNRKGQAITEVNNSIVGVDYDLGNYQTPYPAPNNK
ncbi:hypothetical protein ABK040_011921 [Willaertia magna]